MTAQDKRGNNYATAGRYLSDAARFAETHDPDALARQVPKVMKQVRLGTSDPSAPQSPVHDEKAK